MTSSAALVLLLVVIGAVSLSAAAPPNIIWLQSDSMDGRLFDPTDNVMFNKLILEEYKSKWLSKGVYFARHYTNSPQCVPSRTSMMTGRYVHESYTPNNGQGIAFSTKTGKLDSACLKYWGKDWCTETAKRQRAGGVTSTILDEADKQGYDIATFGRFDTGAGILDDYPNSTGNGYHSGPSLDIIGRGAAIWGSVDSEPYRKTTEDDSNPYSNDVHHHDLTLSWLKDKKKSDKPFFLWLGMLAPHPPYDTNSSYLEHVAADAPDVPALIPRNETHYYDQYMSMSKGVWSVDYTDEQIKKMRQAYWGAVAEASLLKRDVIATADQLGLLDNTVVIITSDHGEMSLEHRQDLKNSLREPSARVPLIIIPFNVPLLRGELVVSNKTSHLDIFPTIIELVGGTIPSDLKGESLVSFLRQDSKPRKKDYVVLQYHSNYAPVGSYGLVQGPWKLIVFGNYFSYIYKSQVQSQLFDTVNDPCEMHDVAAQHPDIVKAMTATLEQELGAPITEIEQNMMEDNVAHYKTYYFDKCKGSSLLSKFKKTFSNNGLSDNELIARIKAWSGASPLDATGTSDC